MFIRELPKSLYHDVYQSAPEFLFDTVKSADKFYYNNCTSIKHLNDEYKSISSTETREDIPNYDPVPMWKHQSAATNENDYYESSHSIDDLKFENIHE